MTVWEELSPGEVEEGKMVVFSQFFDLDRHKGLLRAIDPQPVMVLVNGMVTKNEEREIDTGGGYNVRHFLTVNIFAECLMHLGGMTEEYRFESHTPEGLPEFEFMFTGDERIAVGDEPH